MERTGAADGKFKEGVSLLFARPLSYATDSFYSKGNASVSGAQKTLSWPANQRIVF